MIRLSEPRLNHTQTVRLQIALDRLCNPNSADLVTVADSIPSCDDFLSKGHGTSIIGGEAVATVCGVVERVNKHVSVRPLRSRYHHGRGDIVVGRVLEVSGQRWRTDINCRRNAVLMLSSVNFSGGVQRRRSDVDELNMRRSFVEDDVICAEVSDFKFDGPHLQARTLKHGKLERGQLLRIPPYLVKRQNLHFHHLEQYGIDLILGSNGFVWIGQHKEEEKEEETCMRIEIRQNICRVANAVRVVAALGFTVTVQVIIQTVDLSHSHNVDIHEMLGSEFYVLVAEEEAERRNLNKRKRQ